jgi:hypothetical protein
VHEVHFLILDPSADEEEQIFVKFEDLKGQPLDDTNEFVGFMVFEKFSVLSLGCGRFTLGTLRRVHSPIWHESENEVWFHTTDLNYPLNFIFFSLIHILGLLRQEMEHSISFTVSKLTWVIHFCSNHHAQWQKR